MFLYILVFLLFILLFARPLAKEVSEVDVGSEVIYGAYPDYLNYVRCDNYEELCLKKENK